MKSQSENPSGVQISKRSYSQTANQEVRSIHQSLSVQNFGARRRNFGCVDSLVILGVTLDSKMTFEQHIKDVNSSVTRSIGILRRASTTCFSSYCLSRLEYCEPSWWSGATHFWVFWTELLEGVRDYVDGSCVISNIIDVSRLSVCYTRSIVIVIMRSGISGSQAASKGYQGCQFAHVQKQII